MMHGLLNSWSRNHEQLNDLIKAFSDVQDNKEATCKTYYETGTIEWIKKTYSIVYNSTTPTQADFVTLDKTNIRKYVTIYIYICIYIQPKLSTINYSD